MQFENFDKKVKEAADRHHPAYDENAWKKMEKLLDKHLPEKKDDKRRIIFFLLLFMLLGGGAAWYFMSNPGHPQQTISKTIRKKQQSGTTQTNIHSDVPDDNKKINTSSVSGVDENNEKTSEQKNSDEKIPVAFNRRKYTQALESMIIDRLKKTIRVNTTQQKNNNLVDKQQATVSGIPDKAAGTETGITKPQLSNTNSHIVQNPITSNQDVAINKNISQTNNNNSVTTKQETIKEDENKTANSDKKDMPLTSTSPEAKKTNGKNKKSNYFFLSLSAGPDVSAAGINSLGRLKPVYGVGVGFSFHDKFSLKTGFYSARKVYDASPDEYHPQSNFWTYYPYLNKVDADCRVFEIPLLLSYNFTHSTDHSVFGTVGVSSYLMKRETYNYISKLPSGQTISKEVTYNNKNKHYFSVLTLSGGYQKKINKSVYISAEPYVKIPLDGIGIGKMQLNSAGVLFSLQVKPFKENKKK